jgi:hypothetical protein
LERHTRGIGGIQAPRAKSTNVLILRVLDVKNDLVAVDAGILLGELLPLTNSDLAVRLNFMIKH